MTKFKELKKSKQIILLVSVIFLSLLIMGGIVFLIVLNTMFPKSIKISEGTYSYYGETIELTDNLKIDSIEVTFLDYKKKDSDESKEINVIKDRFDNSLYSISFKIRINGESLDRTISLKYIGAVDVNAYQFNVVNNNDIQMSLLFELTNEGNKHIAQSINLHLSLIDENNDFQARIILLQLNLN